MPRLTNSDKMKARMSVQKLYEDLRGRIVRGELRPGEMVTESKVSESYGVSRTPLREAFWRLDEEGFLRVVPQVGTFIAPINMTAVRHWQFVRETLECKVVAEAAEQATRDDAKRLRLHLDDQQAAIANSDHVAFFAADEAFHKEIMKTCGRAFVWQLIAPAKAQLDRVRFISLENPDWLQFIFTQHEGLLAAIADNDVIAAQRLMQQHLRSAFAAVDRIAVEHSDFFEWLDEPQPDI